MSTRHLNPRLVKIHRSYTVEEISSLFSIHKNTVRTWIKQGLETCAGIRPALIQGGVLKEFLALRRASKKRPCQPGEMYCFKCRAPRRPALSMASYQPKTGSLGNLVAICPECESIMNRRTSLAKIPQIQAFLEITFPQALQHIVDSDSPIVNSDFYKGE